MTRYDTIGQGYQQRRVPDPRLAAAIHAALGDAQTVVNVGAGTGSYEPTDRAVTAVEPSGVMIAQRPSGAAPVVQASAETLPFPDGSFDAAMAVLTIHHWDDVKAGLAEMQRVARRVVILTWDPAQDGFWLTAEYVPGILALDRVLFPSLDAITAVLGQCSVEPLPIPADCTDGFTGAYWRRPEAYLDAAVRGAMSSFARVDAQEGLDRLAVDLTSGRWHERYGHLLDVKALDLGYRLVVASPDG